MLAILNSNVEIVEHLAKSLTKQDVVDINTLSNECKTSSLHLAATMEAVSLTKQLIEAKCELSATDEKV